MSEETQSNIVPENKAVMAVIADLKEHPRNYRSHPDDQLTQLVANIRANGLIRGITIANDNTILCGHGIVKACKIIGLEKIPATMVPYPFDHERSIHMMVSENEMSHLAMDDDRLLSELLKETNEKLGLLGTGYDEKMLANLVFVTRPASEIRDINEASEYIGMPDFELSPSPIKTVISFENDDDKRRFYELVGLKMNDKHTDSIWWPEKERMDLISVKVEATEEPQNVEKPAE